MTIPSARVKRKAMELQLVDEWERTEAAKVAK